MQQVAAANGYLLRYWLDRPGFGSGIFPLVVMTAAGAVITILRGAAAGRRGADREEQSQCQAGEECFHDSSC